MHEATTDPRQAPPSLAALVVRARHYRRLTCCALVCIALIATLSYLQLIWPIFLPHDLSNPQVQRFLVSEDFRATTAPVFGRLERYNAGPGAGAVERPPDLYASSGPVSGLVVVVHYQLVERARGAAGAAESPRTPYAYVPHATVRLDPRYLVAYLALLLVVGLFLYLASRPPPEAQRRFEERVLEDAYRVPAPPLPEQDGDRVEALLALLRRFPVFARQLGVRHAARPAMAFADEYDVQDALHALLKLHYPCVQPEECTPSYAGSGSRIDFLLDDLGIAVEVKMTRPNLRDRGIADQLIIDTARYRAHPRCTHLVCFVYDPAGLLEMPERLKRDLEADGAGIEVSVVIAPAG